MKVIRARNVNDAYFDGLEYLLFNGVVQPSRAGAVMVVPWPVTTVYEHPCERVLFDPQRDANPFFHLFEALWMLAGRRDVAFLNRFVRDFGDRFGEPDGNEHDAYGYRWRRAFGFDQLGVVASKLRRDPTDRQCVIQMWDARWDMLIRHSAEVHAGENDLLGDWKTRPCNTQVYLRVHSGVLDITVCCRSNDLIWGCYGSNVVQFSILQEYLAAQIGVGMGNYYQVSNNYHAYIDVLNDKVPKTRGLLSDPYDQKIVKPELMITQPEHFDKDLENFLTWTDLSEDERWVEDQSWAAANGWAYANGWFRTTATPLYRVHALWRRGEREQALEVLAESQVASDWKLAAGDWMLRRMAKAVKEEMADVG